MSYDDYLRRMTEEQFKQAQQMQNVQSYQVPDHQTAQVINNKLEELRREQDQKKS
ncbi:hypothetical protein [Pseudogemmobacter sonorensis]|uniref:hypothetical protein n=1 Tax=Pseudogemmobacter sonorensis TaxID=2989681 RepID=UPI0036ACEF6F